MARCCRQFLTSGPKTRWFSSQLDRAGDDLAKQNAANNTNGVVGNNGNTAPKMPSTRENTPAVIQIMRMATVLC